MSNMEKTSQFVEKGARRWSEPVRLGEVLADLLTGIEACRPKVASPGRVQALAHVRLRKAG